MKAISLSCSKCGAGLSIPPNVDRLACGFCGTTQMVERSGGIIALMPVTDAIKQVQVGTDRTAAELALNRLNQEWHAAVHHRNQLAAYWQQQHSNAGRSSINLSLFLSPVAGLIVLLILFNVIKAALEQSALRAPWPAAIGFFIGAVVGGLLAVFIFITAQRNARSEEITVAAHRDNALQQADAHIHALAQQIEKNRQIVNS